MELEQVNRKVVMVGDSGVGKTKLLQTFRSGYFSVKPAEMTLQFGFAKERLESNNKIVCLNIWDTVGQERYRSVCKLYYREAKAAVICYDVTDRASFFQATSWVKELQQNEEECKMYLKGTKLDELEKEKNSRKVDTFEARNYAKEIHATLIETSSKTNYNVRKVFQAIADVFAAENVNMMHETTYKEDPDKKIHKLHSDAPPNKTWWGKLMFWKNC